MAERFSPGKKKSKEVNTPMSRNGNLFTLTPLLPPPPPRLPSFNMTIHWLYWDRKLLATNKHFDHDKHSSLQFSKPDATSKNLQPTAYISPYSTNSRIDQQTQAAHPPVNAIVENAQQPPPKKRVRTAYGPMVRSKYEVLEASFRENDTPDEAETHRIMGKTGMDWRKVTKHFSDKRSRMRKLALVHADPQDEVQVKIQRQVKLCRKRQYSKTRTSTADQAILEIEECTACVQRLIQRKSVSIILPAPDALPPYVSLSISAILNSIRADIDHDKYKTQVINKDMARMERDHCRFACSWEMASLQRIAHHARLAGLTFMLKQLGTSSNMESQKLLTRYADILADLDDFRLCLTTSKLLAKAQFRSIVNKLKECKEEASTKVADLERLISERSVSISASRLRGYKIYLVEWQARCLIYRLALTSFVATYYDIEKRVANHSSG
ncbi:hypothetical protein DL98DRAFT_570229 [Cadophora sp. DSE1049]|nr:hypothetical protein DL98DRAFT_570229 [Cadophora sp. DSE1049]